MKKVFFISLILIINVLFYSCDNIKNGSTSDENPMDSTSKNDIINPNSIISVKISVNNVHFRSISDNRSRFITLYAWDMMTSKYRRDIPSFSEDRYYQSRDTIKNCIKFKGRDVIDEKGKLGVFLFAEDIILRVAKDSVGNYINMLNYTGTLELNRDTVAYIPNQVMQNNLKKIQELYDKQDFQACYQLFDTAYQFVPITGEEWLKLKAEGGN